MELDHIAFNAVDLKTELEFLTVFLGLSLLQKWADLKQAYVGFDSGTVIGVIENKNFEGSVYNMAHLAFKVPKDDFNSWVEKVKKANIEIVAGPKPQRGGETILFKTPSKNIIEICYPCVRETITDQVYWA